jgi:O-methyltransferase
MTPEKLLVKFPIISEQMKRDELKVLLRELQKVLEKKVPGDVVELGCYEGTSALFLARMMQSHGAEKQLWLYDSFEGLPEKTSEDESAQGIWFKGGELRASKARLQKNFVKAALPLPEIKRAWFYELDPEDLPDEICFAFLDGDFYESIIDSLKLVWPKMSAGGTIIIDDYQNPSLPGARKAVDEWLQLHPAGLHAEASLAIIRL